MPRKALVAEITQARRRARFTLQHYGLAKMNPVSALTPYTCVLACLESYLGGVGPQLTQCDILKSYPQFCLNPDPQKQHEFGAMSDSQLIAFCNQLGIACSGFKDFRQKELEVVLTSLGKNEAVFFFAHWRRSGHHCVRFSRIIKSGEYEVMNPYFLSGKLEPVLLSDLVIWDFRFYRLTK